MELSQTLHAPSKPPLARRLRSFSRYQLPKLGVTFLGLFLLIIFILPIGYMINTAFKLDTQTTAQNAPIYPAKPVTYSYQGKDLPLYEVPINGSIKKLALLH